MAAPNITPPPQQYVQLSAQPPEQDIDSLNHRRALAVQQKASTNLVHLPSLSEVISHW